MPTKNQLKNRRSIALILEARAGLIPASDYIENELNARTACIGRTVRAYARMAHDPDDIAITDILQDLRHYCDSKGLAFDKLDAAAHDCYLEYVAESPWVSRPRPSNTV
jgi:hypothetical protein